MLSYFGRAVALTSALFISTSAQAQSGNLIDESYDGYSLNWTSSGGMIVRYRPFVVDGKLVICGAYSSQGGARQVRGARAVIKESSVKLNGRVAMRNMSHFAIVNSRHNGVNLEGQSANCRATSVDATQEMLSSFEYDGGDGSVRIRK